MAIVLGLVVAEEEPVTGWQLLFPAAITNS